MKQILYLITDNYGHPTNKEYQMVRSALLVLKRSISKCNDLIERDKLLGLYKLYEQELKKS